MTDLLPYRAENHAEFALVRARLFQLPESVQSVYPSEGGK